MTADPRTLAWLEASSYHPNIAVAHVREPEQLGGNIITPLVSLRVLLAVEKAYVRLEKAVEGWRREAMETVPLLRAENGALRAEVERQRGQNLADLSSRTNEMRRLIGQVDAARAERDRAYEKVARLAERCAAEKADPHERWQEGYRDAMHDTAVNLRRVLPERTTAP